MVPQQLKQIPVRAAGVPPAPESLLIVVLPVPCLAQVLLWVPATSSWRKRSGWKPTTVFGFVVLLGWSAGSLGTWMSMRWGGTGGERPVSHLARLLTARAHSLRQEGKLSGRRSRNNTATGTNCATGLLFLLLAQSQMWLWHPNQSVCLLLLSDVPLKGQHLGSLASHQLLRLQSGLSHCCCPGCFTGSFQPKASLRSCCHLPVLASAPGLWQYMGHHSSPSGGNQNARSIKVGL